ncbi:MAG TPA: tetratricopeptide repeat protein, partial [Verrucomicrobiae bacterium]|nr:tetratricopeptide repeat protein [Verrucomicrobiae bacterium]
HFLNALLVFGVARRALGDNTTSAGGGPNQRLWVAYAVAVLWMLHPLVTESVTYVLQRTELLMALFLLLTLYCFIRGTESPRKMVWFGAAIMACTLGMGTKEVMVMTPLLVLAYDSIFVARSWRAALRERRELYAGLAASWLVLASLLLTTNLKAKSGLTVDVLSPWNYFKMQWTVVAHYLRLSVWPQGLVLDYSDWPRETTLASGLPAAGLLAALFAGTVWAIRRRWWWGFWGAWFFLLLAPTSSFLPLPTEPATERRMYLPLMAVMAVALGGGDQLCRNLWTRFGWPVRVFPWLQAGAMTALALALGIATVQRNGQYQSAESIWADVVAKRPDSLRGHTNLGQALLTDGRAKESIPHFIDALHIDPNEPIARCNLGSALAMIGATNRGIAELQETLQHTPNYAPAHVALADIFVGQGNQRAALEHYAAALDINPDEQVARFNLAQLLTRMGQREGAIAQFTEVLRLDPRNATAHYNLANLLAENGSETEAISHYVAAARFDPHNARSQINLGNLFLKLGRTDDAVAAYTDALRTDPNAFKAHNNLAVILAGRGDLVHAIEHFREAARLQPDAPEVHSELAEVLDRQGLHEEAQRELAQAQRLRAASGQP